MIVFGDAPRQTIVRREIEAVRGFLGSVDSASGIERHGFLVSALVTAGELQQGVEDAMSEQPGAPIAAADDAADAADAARAATLALARAVCRSWNAEFRAEEDASLADARRHLAGLGAAADEVPLRVKRPEGFAHYAVYPEAYALAARELPTDGPLRVVGIRSIGTTLAAIVAAATDAASPVTVRPGGHPFRRELPGDDMLGGDPVAAGDPVYAVVDEGPGLSGSSMAAVAGRLEAAGIDLARIHLLPSHAGEPGPEASVETRRIWAVAPRHVRTFDDLVLRAASPAHRLPAWAEDLTGPVLGEPVEVSGGGWRRFQPVRPAGWAPANAWQERRKFLLRTGNGTWLLRFAGLDRAGREAFRIAQTLGEAGFSPEPAGWRHGFTVERWLDDARPLGAGEPVRPGFADRLGEYLGFRARTFPAQRGAGASGEALRVMALANVAEALGEDAAARLAPLLAEPERLDRRVRPVRTDNRLHPWEWLDVGGRLLKTDAADHGAGHDLIGAQDIAWDVAGAIVEFGLTDGDRAVLVRAVERESGRSVDDGLLAFLLPCYLAFQLGAYTLAVGSAPDPAEAGRLRAAAARYRDRLALMIGEL